MHIIYFFFSYDVQMFKFKLKFRTLVEHLRHDVQI